MSELITIKNDYKQWLESQKYSPGTIYNYTLFLTQFLIYESTQENVEHFLRKHNTPTCRAFLKNFKEYARVRGFTLDYIIPKIKGRKGNKIVDYLTEQEYHYLLDNIPEPEIKLLIQAMVESCCRISEVLDWTPLNIQFTETGAKVRGIGKGKKPYEALIGQDTAEQLTTLSETLFHDKERFWRINRKTAWKKIRKYGQQILGRQLNPHMLKATGLSILYHKGHPFEYIKEYARHESFDTTMRYVHLFDKEKQEKQLRKIIK